MTFPRSFLNLTNLPDGTVLATGGGTDKSGFVDANGGAPGRGLEPGRGVMDHLRADERAAPLPLGRGAPARTGGCTSRAAAATPGSATRTAPRSSRRPTCSREPGRPSPRRRRPSNYGSYRLRRHPRRRLDLAGVADPHRVGHPRLRPERPRDPAQLHPDRRRPQRDNALATATTSRRATTCCSWSTPRRARRSPRSSASRLPTRTPAPPTAPTELVATGGEGTVALKWTAATDDQGVAATTSTARARPASPRPPPTGSARPQPRPSTTPGLPAGTWYYKVTAEDAVGNVGPPSNEAQAMVTATPPRARRPGSKRRPPAPRCP